MLRRPLVPSQIRSGLGGTQYPLGTWRPELGNQVWGLGSTALAIQRVLSL